MGKMKDYNTQVNFGDKLYIITRNDLIPGSQMAQVIHAYREFIEEHTESEKLWYEKSNHICVLAVKNLLELEKLERKAEQRNIVYSSFIIYIR